MTGSFQPVRRAVQRCLAETVSPTTGDVEVCGKELPPGPMPHIALNSPTGYYLALCEKHRVALQESFEDWLYAAVGQGALSSALTDLRDGRLVSHSELRQFLRDKGETTRTRGPLKRAEELRAIELMYGPKVAARVEESNTAS